MEKQTITYLAIGLAVLVGAMVFLGWQPFTTTQTTSGQQPFTTTPSGMTCDMSTAFEVATRTNDVFEKGVDQTVDTYLYTADGKNVVASATDLANLDASGATEYVVIAGLDGSLALDDYYFQIKKINTECTNPYTVFFDLYAEGDAVVTLWNEDGSVNSVTSEQAIGAGDLAEVKIQIRAPTEASFGAPYAENTKGVLVCFDYDSAVYRSVEVEGAKKANIPTFEIGTSLACWELNRNSFKDTLTSGRERQDYMVLIQALAGVAPSSNDIDVRLIDGAGYLNTRTGMFEYGYEDYDGADIGVEIAVASGTINIAF